jgi:hypothetical protein
MPSSLNKWSFGALMKEMVSADDAGTIDFTKRWLGQYRSTQTVNDQTVPPRDVDQIWKGWEGTTWDLRRVPFRLLAIINRIDLLRSPLLAGENAGEVRFVFGAVDISEGANCMPLSFTVILEYGVRKSSCAELQRWAQSWVDLAKLAPSDVTYREGLSQLTNSVTGGDPNRAKPNGSAIDHVRTNEILNAAEWQLREFRLDPASHQLVQDTVTMTPRNDLAGQQALTTFLTSIENNIAVQDYWIPRRFPTPPSDPLLGAMAIGGTDWKQSSDFSMNTCSGCHTGDGLAHIDPIAGTPSPFLAQVELPRREIVLNQLAQDGCAASLSTKERRLVH